MEAEHLAREKGEVEERRLEAERLAREKEERRRLKEEKSESGEMSRSVSTKFAPRAFTLGIA